MIATLIPTDSGADPIPLAPGVEARLGDCVSGLTVNGAVLVQDVPLFRAEAGQVFSRGNRFTTISFQVYRLHADQNAANEFVLKHETDLGPGEGVVQFRNDASPSTTTGWQLNSAVVTASSQVIGITTITTYQIRGGAVTAFTDP